MNKEEKRSILVEVKSLIEKGFAQGAFGRSGDGTQLDDTRLDDAVCYCIRGAVIYALYDNKGTYDRMKYHEICDILYFSALKKYGKGFFSLIQFNDASTTTQQDVIALVDYALENL